MAKKRSSKEVIKDQVKESLELTKETVDTQLKEVLEDDQVAVETYLSDPKVKEEQLQTAHYLVSKFRNWFTLEQVVQKTPWKEYAQAQQVLQMLSLGGFVGTTENENKPGTIKYKVTLDKNDKAEVIELEIIRLEKDVVIIEQQYRDRIEILKRNLKDLK